MIVEEHELPRYVLFDLQNQLVQVPDLDETGLSWLTHGDLYTAADIELYQYTKL